MTFGEKLFAYQQEKEKYKLVSLVFDAFHECPQCPYRICTGDVLNYGSVKVINETHECRILTQGLPPDECPGFAARMLDQQFDNEQGT